MLLSGLTVAICLLIATSMYLVLIKPPPQFFSVGDQFRIQPEIPVNQAHLPLGEVLQWTSDTLQQVFTLDFLNYNDQLASYKEHFTPEGWKVFLNQLNNYVNYNTVKSKMLFSSAVPNGAPFVLNQGLLSGRYAWWVQMPIKIKFVGVGSAEDQSLTLQILVVRVPTKDNLSGVAIDNVIVDTGSTTAKDV